MYSDYEETELYYSYNVFLIAIHMLLLSKLLVEAELCLFSSNTFFCLPDGLKITFFV